MFMIDSNKCMIVVKDQIKTNEIISYTDEINKYNITFKNGKTYSYSKSNVIIMNNPVELNPKNYSVEIIGDKILCNIEHIYQFRSENKLYWHIVSKLKNYDYRDSQIRIIENCQNNKNPSEVFDYLKDISKLSKIDGKQILNKYFDEILSISNSSVLNNYLNPAKTRKSYNVSNLIFPFGCNQSQYKAVKYALNNQISIVQGPPGTGKTQTILNIIANLIINNKTVIVVSNNNSATNNVLEKLAKKEYGMDFMVASLGNANNKTEFVAHQLKNYPNLASWHLEGKKKISLKNISELSSKLEKVYLLEEDIAKLKDLQYNIELEKNHFDEIEINEDIFNVRVRRKTISKNIMKMWQEIQERFNNNNKISFWQKIKSILVYGIGDWDFFNQKQITIIFQLQKLYYKYALNEIKNNIEKKQEELNSYKDYNDNNLKEKSLAYFKDIISQRYNYIGERKFFSEKDIINESKEFLKEYPIVLSTTFSARANLAPNEEYDYVIMDEASQVDVATGALALSCAKNAVIVGDLKQLPNVVTSETMRKATEIKNKYNIQEAYDFGNNSFLKSIIELMPDVSSTLLREHYRCHPRIISFCNQKFYNNELVIMTNDDMKNKSLSVVKSVVGNHARGNYNERQIDIIYNEILPKLREEGFTNDDIGIIAPYNAQVNALYEKLYNIDIATVHKFQGREKKVIILSTVDDQIKEFTDDPYLLNVAVSRAKERLIVVISGNEQIKKGNIVDLISYIQYNKMEVIDSKIYSVFDFLYSQYRSERWKYFKTHNRISEFDSENLSFNLLSDILHEFPDYDLTCFEPLSLIIKDMSNLNEDEKKYILNPGTHVDFLIFNKFNKQPILAIETDGYVYHKEGTIQYNRDIMKNHILQLNGLPLIRLKTNGSGERDIITNKLKECILL